MTTHKSRGRLWISGGLSGLAALLAASAATSGVAGTPTAVSLRVSPGGAACTYSETTTPKIQCAKLRGERIKSGTKITLVATANAPMPAGWQLYIQREGPLADNNAAHAAASHRKSSYPAPHLCGPTKSASCTARATRKVSVTSFDLFRAVVQKDDGTSFETDLEIRWCDTSSPGCA